MATENLTTGASRRAILKFASAAVAYTSGAAIVGTGMAMATQAKAETPGISTALAAKIAASQGAADACLLHDRTVLEPLYGREKAAVASIPHVTIPVPGDDTTEWTTADKVKVAIARATRTSVAKYGPTGHGDMRDAALIDLADAADRRDAEIDNHERAPDLQQAEDESGSLGEALAEAYGEVYDFPVETVADLEAKIAFMVEKEAFDIDGTGESILTDVRRILAAREA